MVESGAELKHLYGKGKEDTASTVLRAVMVIQRGVEDTIACPPNLVIYFRIFHLVGSDA